MEKLVMTRVTPDFWKHKRVLLTGHTGFKGSWLSLWLQSMGAQLYGLALSPPTTPALFNQAQVGEGMQETRGDIRDYDTVHQVIHSYQPEIIIHMAAQPLVQDSYQRPTETYATNVMGTVHILEAARTTQSIRAIVNVTTDKCYDNKEWVWGYREIEPMGGRDPYSSSKGCSELVTQTYRCSFFQNTQIALASARAGNVIGGGDWAHNRLVPDVLRAFEQKKTAIIRNPQSVRPWQHVLEPLSGYLMLAEHLYKHGHLFAEAWNFGPSEEDTQPVQWVVEQLAQLWGNGAAWQQDHTSYPHEATLLTLDISKARTKLQWAPRWNLSTALKKIVDWHHTWLSQENIKEKCLQQIMQYQTMSSNKN